MENISFSKSDLKILFVLSMTIPLMSFIFGFFLAQKSEPDTSRTSTAHLTDKAFQPAEGASSIDMDGMEAIVVSKKSLRINEAHEVQPPTEAVTLKVKSVTPATNEVVSIEPTSNVKRYIVQAGLFASVENAKKFTRTLTQTGLSPQIISEFKNDVSLFRVYVGSFASQKEAWSYSRKMKKEHSINLVVTDTHAAKLKDLVAAR